VRNRDSHYPYRFDSHFYYLSGFAEPEAVLVLDTGTWNQLGNFGPFLKTLPAAKMVIDHHLTQDDLGALRLGRPGLAGPPRQHGAERLRRERLDQEIVHAGGQAGLAVVVEDVGGQRDDRQLAEPVHLPDREHRIVAIHFWEHDVHQNEIYALHLLQHLDAGLVVGLHPPAVGRVGLFDVDGDELDAVGVAAVQVFQDPKLGSEGASREAAEDQDDGLLPAVIGQGDTLRLIGCLQSERRRLLAQTRPLGPRPDLAGEQALQERRARRAFRAGRLPAVAPQNHDIADTAGVAALTAAGIGFMYVTRNTGDFKKGMIDSTKSLDDLRNTTDAWIGTVNTGIHQDAAARAAAGGAAGPVPKDPEGKLKWLRSLLDWQQDLADPKEFMETLKVDLFEDEVFVFTPKGEVKSLAAGATPLDFAYEIHTDVGHRCCGAKVNGKIVPLSYQLRSGDIVEVLTSKRERGPSRDWLALVKTTRARNKIKAWFKAESRKDTEHSGRELLQDQLKKQGLPAQKLVGSPLLAATLTIFLISLIGIPITGGFFAKFYVFSAAVKANLIGLTIIGVLNSGIGAYYYLRIIVVMYMRESRREVPTTPVTFTLRLALALCMAATIYLGVFPESLLQYTQESAQQLVEQVPPQVPLSSGILRSNDLVSRAR